MGLARTAYRAAFLAVVVVAASVLLVGFLTAPTSSSEAGGDAWGAGSEEAVVPPSDGITVVATDSNSMVAEEGDGPRARSELIAFAPDGTVLYYNDTHTRYWDVDPVPGTTATVEYIYSDYLTEEECNARTACTRNGVERVNLSTGEVEQVWERTDTYVRVVTGLHDHERVDEHRIAIADIYEDRVFIVNATTGITEWSWDAQTDFPIDGGGPFPNDWTHVNDVDLLDDGRLMASLRNQDQVVFLDRETGLEEGWTLGTEDDHDTLYEQHNPDFIPEERGGPAVVVADSENNRVVEFQREDGEWEQTWEWSDRRMQWPRDADRLPNGNTLITDSNGNRVLEVDPDGEVVWSIDIGFPYEAERLETGEGSTDGTSADELGLRSVTRASVGDAVGGDGDDEQRSTVLPTLPAYQEVLPGKIGNAVAYALPIWMGSREFFALVALVVALLAWGALEAYWSRWSVRLRRPLLITADEGEPAAREDGGEP